MCVCKYMYVKNITLINYSLHNLHMNEQNTERKKSQKNCFHFLLSKLKKKTKINSSMCRRLHIYNVVRRRYSEVIYRKHYVKSVIDYLICTN